ncbi:MAG: serine/threonine protein kinase [Planctomycetales bacterium]
MTTITEFLKNMELSRLLSLARVAALRETGIDDPKILAASLVQQEYLTYWQAKELLSGRKNFFLGGYRLLEKLGEGRIGSVYKAERITSGHVVAVKFLRSHMADKPEAVARFLREIRVTAALSHPHVVVTHDAEVIDSGQIFVMEYVEGKELKDWIAEHDGLPIPWSCECARQVALGLQHIHENGLVHRDLEPGNLMVIGDSLQEPPWVKIMDLGLVRMLAADEDSITMEGQMLGNIDYVSPEQAENAQKTDIRSDIFSLGCVLYETLAGRQPYSGNSIFQKIAARDESPPLVGSLRPGIPAELDAVVNAMLQPDREARIQTPRQVADALTPFAMPLDETDADLIPLE